MNKDKILAFVALVVTIVIVIAMSITCGVGIGMRIPEDMIAEGSFPLIFVLIFALK